MTTWPFGHHPLWGVIWMTICHHVKERGQSAKDPNWNELELASEASITRHANTERVKVGLRSSICLKYTYFVTDKVNLKLETLGQTDLKRWFVHLDGLWSFQTWDFALCCTRFICLLERLPTNIVDENTLFIQDSTHPKGFALIQGFAI